MATPRVLLADDHRLLLEAFEKLLAGECEIVGQVADGRELLAAAENLKPDLIVLDISMPLLNGLDAGRQIKAKLRDVRLVFLTMNEDADIAAEAFRCGRVGVSAEAVGRLGTEDGDTRGHAGAVWYITPLMTGSLVGSLMHGVPDKPAHELTSRQREILQLLAEGKSMKEAASTLNVAPRTVAFHKYRMMEKLGVKSSAELIQYAVKQHIV